MELRYGIPFPIDEIILIGCGGTGGYIAPHVARIAYIIKSITDIAPRIVFVDPDTVEIRNINRQNFIYDDIGKNKARVLAERYSMAFDVDIEFVESKLVPLNNDGLNNVKLCYKTFTRRNFIDFSRGNTLIIDALDNLSTRKNAIYRTMFNGSAIDTTEYYPCNNCISENVILHPSYFENNGLAARLFMKACKHITKQNSQKDPTILSIAALLASVDPLGTLRDKSDVIYKLTMDLIYSGRGKVADFLKIADNYNLKHDIEELLSFEEKARANAATWISVGNNKTSGQVVISSTDKLNNIIYGSVILPRANNNPITAFKMLHQNVDDINLIKKMMDPNILDEIIDIFKIMNTRKNIMPSVVELFKEQYDNSETEDALNGNVSCALNAFEEPQNLAVNYTASAQVVEAMYNMIFGSINYSISYFDTMGNTKKIAISDDPFNSNINTNEVKERFTKLTLDDINK